MTDARLSFTDWKPEILDLLRRGTVIPAHPLALGPDRGLDRESQRALARYYIDAGSGGLAVGVHSTQFAIREVGLYEPVLSLAMETARAWADRPLVMIAGAIGKTQQAVAEARIARSVGYHAVLLSLAAMRGAGEDELIDHCRAVAAEMPLIGFYLQAAVGGIPLSRRFWTRFAAIENVVAVKVAPFNRYGTLDVAFGIVAAGAEERVTLYTGNDDHIVSDLVTPFRIRTPEREAVVRFRGGLLGHWSVWTSSAVRLLRQLQEAVAAGPIAPEILALDGMVTDCNAVIFDVAHNFAGCIPGCHEILRRQGLMRSIACLDPHETLSPGQAEEIDRLYATYPEWADDDFVAENLHRWRSA
ncbi:MAG TPA: dihydrodipicolinate synthase family protein [Microvirga sp.]|jgi:dihydrodipicolinate synthase/N-acetylneuraminate lyase|nr:dihydrodipicolinate synthase family protein [Microvirga sp.]